MFFYQLQSPRNPITYPTKGTMTSTTLSALFACKHFCSFFIRFKGAKVSESEKENLGVRGGGMEKVSHKKLDSRVGRNLNRKIMFWQLVSNMFCIHSGGSLFDCFSSQNMSRFLKFTLWTYWVALTQAHRHIRKGTKWKASLESFAMCYTILFYFQLESFQKTVIYHIICILSIPFLHGERNNMLAQAWSIGELWGWIMTKT